MAIGGVGLSSVPSPEVAQHQAAFLDLGLDGRSVGSSFLEELVAYAKSIKDIALLRITTINRQWLDRSITFAQRAAGFMVFEAASDRGAESDLSRATFWSSVLEMLVEAHTARELVESEGQISVDTLAAAETQAWAGVGSTKLQTGFGPIML